MTKTKKKKKVSPGDRIFGIVVTLVVLAMCIMVLYPIYYMFIVSISDGNAVLRGDITVLPQGINFGAYKAVLTNEYVPRAYLNTILYTVNFMEEDFLQELSCSPCSLMQVSFQTIW